MAAPYRMSALGQKHTFAPQKVMSALPPKADMCGAARDVRYGPKADMGNRKKARSERPFRVTDGFSSAAYRVIDTFFGEAVFRCAG
jgi:hypothetical protein